MRTTNFFGHEITRLIVGDNPFTGHSYIEHLIPGKEMKDYYDSKKLYETLFQIEEAGYNCMIPLAHPFNLQIIREYQRDGGKMKFMFQPYMPMRQEVSMREMEAIGAIGIYHQGTTTDFLYEHDRCDEIKAQIQQYKSMGIPVGVGTHVPAVIKKAEAEDWGADFYMACVHNARRGREKEPSGFLSGKEKVGIRFFPEDRPVMLDLISKLEKPCIAFKIFAGGQALLEKDQEKLRENIKGIYREVFSKLKPGDLAAIGVFNKYKDQIKEDAELFEEAMRSMETEI